jgi:chemotaxis signal transduction protein
VVAEKIMNASEDLPGESNRRLMAFAFRGSENGIDIKIIGRLKLRPAPRQPMYSKGIVLINDKAFSVFDLKALAGLKPKTISNESCIVLLDPDENFGDFCRAIIVDDVSEMLRIAKRDMEGLPVDTLFGGRPKKTAPDFPFIESKRRTAIADAHSKTEGKEIAPQKKNIIAI